MNPDSKDYEPESFWNQRFTDYGHTGSGDPVLYAYDQPQRLRAIDLALSRAGIALGANSHILDVGCGSGDIIDCLLQHGNPQLTGIDISQKTIQSAQQRFIKNKNVKLVRAGLETAHFPAESFELITGVNVLQHIIDSEDFSKAMANLVRFVKRDGYILVMDFSPIEPRQNVASFVIMRTRGEYIDVFQRAGCRLVSEVGLPRIGVRLYRNSVCNKVVALLAKLVSAVNEQSASETFLRSLLLKFAAPFDHCLTPFPYRLTDMRIFVFQKAG